ncbi:hypothetical protein ACH4FX_31380 [Streptomyces sp. NPDC018019]|uniref:hypothetical protein n=1 Tax=Streptomyces sp. NPDC018019 TaxID=3365030 RepID=UPI0037B15404
MTDASGLRRRRILIPVHIKTIALFAATWHNIYQNHTDRIAATTRTTTMTIRLTGDGISETLPLNSL